MKENLTAGDTNTVHLDCPLCKHEMPHEMEFKRFSAKNQLVLVKVKCLGCCERANIHKKPHPEPVEKTYVYDTFKKLWTHGN